MSDGPSFSLIPDSPIEGPSSDRLDRMGFVRSFTEAIRAVDGDDSVVLALAGPWGSGKSSLLNLVESELENDSHPALVVRFNPWWFTGTGRMITAFLEQLGSAASRPEAGETLARSTPLMSQLASAIELPGANSQSKDIDPASRDIEKLRERLNQIFRGSPRRVLIFMDDVDRLTPEEMTQLLLIVRAVADFPNTTYVLAFDHGVVSDAISNRLGVDGRTYLEKVVLLQIDVPMPGRMALERMVMSQLEAIDPDAARLDEDAQRHFRILFESGVRHFLGTPRACTRMLNVLRFTYPLQVGRVYFPDMLGISCLLSFSSQAIQAIRTTPDAFVGPCDPAGDGWVRMREYHLAWLDEVQPRDRPFVELIVRVLFPKVAWALNGPLRGHEYVETWDRQKRICSEQHFDSYFRLGLSQGEASDHRWRTMVELLDDATSFARALDRFGPLGDAGANSTGSLTELLQRACDFVIEQATPEQAGSMFRAVIRRGDQIAAINLSPHEKIDYRHHVITLLTECLASMNDPAERLRHLTEAIGDDAALLTACELLDSLDFRPKLFTPHGESPSQDAHTAKLVEVLKLLDGRIQSAASSGELLAHPLFMRILQKWWKFGRRTKAQKWLALVALDDKALASAILQTRPMSDLEAAAIAPHLPDSPSLGVALPLDFLFGVFGHRDLKHRVHDILNASPEWLDDDAAELLEAIETAPET